ncbi:MAG: YceD family protein [Corynebacterium sp.]|nr:YceD family protein [Corynebacterium sp.]
MKNTSNSPFVFDVFELMRNGTVDYHTQTGPSPTRIGPAMIAIPEGGNVTVDATLTPLGDAIMVDANIHAQLQGECVRCLTPLHPEADLHVTQVFAATEDFITGDEADDDETDDVPMITNDHIDLLQSIIDEAGMTLPFNPVCPNDCNNTEVPEPDGVSGETEEKIDPRWSGLEKYL